MTSCFHMMQGIGFESKTTRMFRPVRQVAVPASVWSRSSGLAAPGSKSAVSDCVLFYCRNCSCDTFTSHALFAGDPSRFHSFYIAVCADHSKPLSVLDLVCLGRLGTTVKKTTLLCSVDSDGQVCCTSLQWSGIS